MTFVLVGISGTFQTPGVYLDRLRAFCYLEPLRREHSAR
jgi:hypothetical protein